MRGIFDLLLGLELDVALAAAWRRFAVISLCMVSTSVVWMLVNGEVVTNFLLVQVDIGFQPVDFATGLMRVWLWLATWLGRDVEQNV